eukprot:1518382-Rhodomonas_salina.1
MLILLLILRILLVADSVALVMTTTTTTKTTTTMTKDACMQEVGDGGQWAALQRSPANYGPARQV